MSMSLEPWGEHSDAILNRSLTNKSQLLFQIGTNEIYVVVIGFDAWSITVHPYKYHGPDSYRWEGEVRVIPRHTITAISVKSAPTPRVDKRIVRV